MSIEMPLPGIPLEEFIDEHGIEAYQQVPHTKIVSWNHEVYILEGWSDDGGD